MSKLQRREDVDILNWLTPVDYGPQQSDCLKKRQRGTGEGLLTCGEYQIWLDTSGRTLFCPGIPGSGKTILTSVVVDDITNRFHHDATVGIAYVYCNFKPKYDQKVDDLLASLAKQLAESLPSLLRSVKDLHDRHRTKRTRPLLEEISSTLYSVATKYSRIFIIVDALDEYQTTDRNWKKFLTELFTLQAKTGANLFATSRHIPDIEKEFRGCLIYKIVARYEDVCTYLDTRMSQLRKFIAKSPDLQKEIKDKIARATDGMYASH